jgi:hypothetical protein
MAVCLKFVLSSVQSFPVLIARFFLPLFFIVFGACGTGPSKQPVPVAGDRAGVDLKAEALATLERYHLAAAEARFDEYFDLMADSSVFVGTDPGEHWSKMEFMEYARPHFDKGKAWTMRPVECQMHFSADSNLVWFEELLDTRMKLCRGSGVMSRNGQGWLIEQYVLSPTIPNSLMKDAIAIKESYDDSLLSEIMPRADNTKKP